MTESEAAGYGVFSRVEHALLWLFTLVLHLELWIRYPMIYGGDTILRLANFPQVFYSYQLPLFQVLLNSALFSMHSPWSVAVLMAAIVAAGASGMAMLVLRLGANQSSAWTAALIYVTHPFLLYYSRVPYQEALMLAGLLWGFYFLFGPDTPSNRTAMSLSFAVASLTRYEGWIAAAVALVVWIFLRRKRFSRRESIKAFLVFFWAPMLWILWNLGLSPEGTFVLDWRWIWDRWYRPYFIAKTALWWTPAGVLALVLAGLCAAAGEMRQASRVVTHGAFALLLLLFFPMLVFSAHGISPDPEKFVTEREAFIPTAFLVLYAGLGYQWFQARLHNPMTRRPVLWRSILLAGVVGLAAINLVSGMHRVCLANLDDELRLGFDAASFLREKNAGAIVYARPLPEAEIRKFLKQAERTGGTEGLRKAEELLRVAETTPLDYQRILVHSWMGKRKILASEHLRGLDPDTIDQLISERDMNYLIRFNDFTPANEQEKSMLSLLLKRSYPVAWFNSRTRKAEIYELIKNPDPKPLR